MKIFVILSRVPWPLEKGDKMRAWHQLKELSKRHEICLFCLSDSNIDAASMQAMKEVRTELHIEHLNKPGIVWRLFLGLFNKLPFQVNYFFRNRIQRKVNKVIDQFQPDHIYCQLIRCSEYVKHIHHIPKTLDYMDAFSKGIARRVDTAPALFRPVFRMEAKRLVAYENLIFDYFEHKTIITEQDRKLIYHPEQDKIAVIPNGVDTSFFIPLHREKKYDLVFNGNMSYPPNVDCVKHLVLDILPMLRKNGITPTLLISGASPDKEVLELAKHPGVTVSGWVDDQRESYAAGKIFVAPFRIGTGLQNKLLEAMSMEIPCVTSTLANNALKATPDKEIFTASDASGFAVRIQYLLQNPNHAEAMAKAGREYVLNSFNWEASVNKLEDLLSSK
jgi:sugar transferase (PEP-CTERM/EpsH1 system associated)